MCISLTEGNGKHIVVKIQTHLQIHFITLFLILHIQSDVIKKKKSTACLDLYFHFHFFETDKEWFQFLMFRLHAC